MGPPENAPAGEDRGAGDATATLFHDLDLCDLVNTLEAVALDRMDSDDQSVEHLVRYVRAAADLMFLIDRTGGGACHLLDHADCIERRAA